MHCSRLVEHAAEGQPLTFAKAQRVFAKPPGPVPSPRIRGPVGCIPYANRHRGESIRQPRFGTYANVSSNAFEIADRNRQIECPGRGSGFQLCHAK
ncbi:MAG: hypothetical protein DME76_04170 [Verrucomicrobia bacterium]|nr:MAG: hypothetical protein DME76_04170 [Verrucomicrobiota bacterium]